MTKSWFPGLVLWLAALLAGCGGGSTPGDGVPLALIDPVTASPGALASVRKAAGPVPQNGFWWNPAESGRGYAIEVQGSQVFLGAYMYEASGVATWYLATLAQQADGAFVGALNRYSGGQTLLGAYKAPSTITAVAQASLSFSTPGAGTLSLQMADGSGNRAIPIERLGFSTPAFAPPVAGFQGGLWWNPAEGGRGYFLEVQGNQAFVGSFMYDASGQPVWYLTGATIQDDDTVAGVLQQYAGGQSLNGVYRPAAPAATPGQVRLGITSTSTANLTLPDGRMLAIARAIAPAADACAGVRSGFTGDIELVAAGPGGVGGDGGGAAAGGGLGKVLGGLLRVVDLSDGSLVGEAVTDGTLGLVTVRTCQRRGPFLLTLEGREGAKYFDEGLDQLTDFGPGQVLHALVDTWDEHVGVSPLTEAAYRYALNNFKANAAQIAGGAAPLKASGGLVGLTAAQVAQANSLVAAEFNSRFTADFALVSARTLPTPIDAGSAASVLKNNRYGRAAAVNGGLVKSARLYNGGLAAPALALTADLARDLTDGRLNGFALDGSQVAAADRTSYESVRLPLAGMIGTHDVARRFGATAMAAGPLTVDEWDWLSGVGGPASAAPGVTLCDRPSFSEQIGLMSDGSVTIERLRYVRPDGSCLGANEVGLSMLYNYVTQVRQIQASTEGVAYAVRQDGSVLGWGENLCGAMGPNLPYAIYDQPQTIDGLRDITSISTHAGTTLARDRSGRVFIWGIDNAATSSSTIPAVPGRTLCASAGSTRYFRYAGISPVDGLSNVAKVFTRSGSHFAITTDGRVFAWGAGTGGRLANGTVSANGGFNGPRIDLPTPIAGLSGVRDLTFYRHMVFATLADGSVKTWGADTSYPESGVAKYIARPTTVAAFNNVRELAVSSDGLFLLKNDGSTKWWRDIESTLAFLTIDDIVPSSPVRHIRGQSDDMELSVFFQDGRLGLSLTYQGDARGIFR